jgi:LEA14-like dessication related protein
MRSLFLWFGLAASLMLAGCGTPPEHRLESPVMTVTGIKTNGATTVLTVRLVNANTVPLAVESGTYTVYIGSERIGRVSDKMPVGIPPQGGVNHSVILPASLAADISAYTAKHPEATSLEVESTLVIAIWGSDTLTLKTSGAGSLK